MWTEPGPKASCERHWLFSQLLEKGEGGGKHTKKLPATRPRQHRGQRAFGVQRSEALEGWGPQDRRISAAEIDQSEQTVSQGAQGKVPSCEMTSSILSAYRGAGEIGLPGPRPLTGPERLLQPGSRRRAFPSPPSPRSFSGRGSSRVSLAKGSSRAEVRVRESTAKHLSSSAPGRRPSRRCLCRPRPLGQPADWAPLPRAALRASGTPPPPRSSRWSGTPSQSDAEGECPGRSRGE